MEDAILFEQKGNIAILTLNRPKTLNAIDDSMIECFEKLINRINQSHSICVAIITGQGRAFCAGGNVKQMRDKEGWFDGNAEKIAAAYRHGVQRIPRAMATLEVPAIAAVNGPAIGAGCDITLMCDMRIASSNAKFAESFVKLGLIPGDGGAWFLPRAIGQSRAAEMTYTGDSIDSALALEWGLVSRVVAPELLMDEALKLAERIASNPGYSLRMTKQLLKRSEEVSLDTMLELAAVTQSVAHQMPEHVEAVTALIEKRAPDFNKNT